MSKPLTAILIGAGERGGRVYGTYALNNPDEIRFVSVADPNDLRRSRIAEQHYIPENRRFTTWEDCLDLGQIADVAVIATMDHLHVGPAGFALEVGYHVLLEKPMATSLADCVKLVNISERNNRILQICHVLRYTSFFSTLHEVLSSGRLGEIITMEHRENVAYWHMAHSYVRGHWRDTVSTCPMILSKCCHDLDILFWNLGRVKTISSVGSLRHFVPSNAPEGAPERCTDGCPAENSCPWYAPRLYLDLIPLYQSARRSPRITERLGAKLLLDHQNLSNILRRLIPRFYKATDYHGWPISVISEDPSPEARWQALENGPWGRCVYYCDNDVVDHQIVSMEMKSGATATLIMHGHSHQESRSMRYDGTQATLRGVFCYGMNDVIEIHDHITGKVERIYIKSDGVGHGGGDEGLMAAFIRTVQSDGQPMTSARESLESHMMAFAAEQARIDGSVIEVEEYRRNHVS